MGSRSRKKVLGALATAAGGTISQLAILGAKEGAQSRRDKMLAAREERMLGLGQKFKTAERIAGEEFQTGEGVLERESRETIAGAKAKSAAERAKEKRRFDISAAIPQFATKLLELNELSSEDFDAVAVLAQQLALGGEANSETDALKQAKRIIIDEPETRRALEAEGFKLPRKQGTTALRQKSFTGTLTQQAGGLPPGITETDIQTTMKNNNLSREEAIKLAEQFVQRKGR